MNDENKIVGRDGTENSIVCLVYMIACRLWRSKCTCRMCHSDLCNSF